MMAIVDYGLGNIKAFANVYKKLNINCFYAKSPDDLLNASKIILPGVGAFDHAMNLLNASGLRSTLDSLILEKGIPVLGVCVGMQMMASSSEEGNQKGLGWIPGVVKKFEYGDSEALKNLPLPHMGWNSLVLKANEPLFSGFSINPVFYFLHSYFFECSNEESCIGVTDYGRKFNSIVKFKNAYGIQCHPEKSHHNGVRLLQNFAEL